jgi:hypothetical protein
MSFIVVGTIPYITIAVKYAIPESLPSASFAGQFFGFGWKNRCASFRPKAKPQPPSAMLTGVGAPCVASPWDGRTISIAGADAGGERDAASAALANFIPRCAFSAGDRPAV